MLEVKHISFSWGRGPLLDDVSFTVAPGEIPEMMAKLAAELE